eukprot:m.89415 g.89415  ORF g.89415 m.89415 type:complete len:639 (-) comp13219_c0_seq1:299-2215(-)
MGLKDGSGRNAQAESDSKVIEKKKKAFDSKLASTQFLRLAKIIIPRWWCKESRLLGCHSVALLGRTFLSLYIAYLQGSIVKEIVDRNVKGFLTQLLKWMAIAVPASLTNSLLRYMESELALAFRHRLSKHAYSLYFKGNCMTHCVLACCYFLHSERTYYKVCNIDGRLPNPDQNLTEDIARFCTGTAHLYSHISKPLLDVILICAAIIRNNFKNQSARGFLGLVKAALPLGLAGGTIALTGLLLKLFSPPFGRLVSELAAREGHLRFVHSRVITNAEEIAFLRGERVEENVLFAAFCSLKEQSQKIYKKRLSFVVLEQFMMKYMWTAVGNIMIAIAALGSSSKATVSERALSYTVSNNLLVNGSDAIERIMSSYKEVVELAGYTSRVVDMLNVFKDVQNGRYERQNVASPPVRSKVLANQNEVWMEDLPIITPSGDCLLENLTLKLPRGQHILISGPNGCGKSSLFRIIAGLWPLYRGTLSTVNLKDILYVPQRPYLTLGNFRAQVIYPDSVEEMQSKGWTDELLLDVLKHAHLDTILEREGGWDSVAEWKDLLSGGEKQRIGMARLFYHKPKYALLDECTSAVSIDVEGNMYQHAKDLGITLLTITHRPSLWKFHTHILKYDGEGGYQFSEFSPKEV